MPFTVELPDDLLAELRRRAEEGGRALDVELADALRRGLGTVHAAPVSPSMTGLTMVTDARTGLPVVQSPPGAPITRMTAAQLEKVLFDLSEQEDREQLGGSV